MTTPIIADCMMRIKSLHQRERTETCPPRPSEAALLLPTSVAMDTHPPLMPLYRMPAMTWGSQTRTSLESLIVGKFFQTTPTHTYPICPRSPFQGPLEHMTQRSEHLGAQLRPPRATPSDRWICCRHDQVFLLIPRHLCSPQHPSTCVSCCPSGPGRAYSALIGTKRRLERIATRVDSEVRGKLSYADQTD